MALFKLNVAHFISIFHHQTFNASKKTENKSSLEFNFPLNKTLMPHPQIRNTLTNDKVPENELVCDDDLCVL